MRIILGSLVVAAALGAAAGVAAQSQGRRYAGADGAIRVALSKQPLSPNGPSKGPATMADGGIQKILTDLGAAVRVDEARLSAEQEKEYGGWKRLGMSLGHFADLVAKNERDGYFTVGLLATCPSMPGLVAGLQRPASGTEAQRVGMLWLDAHPDFNTPETTRSGSLGGMPVAVATGRALQVMRLDATLDPPLSDRHVVMGGVRLTDPLEQRLLDGSMIEQLSVDDLVDDVAGGVGPARSPQPDQRQALHPYRHGRARPARSHGPRQQGAGRPVERGAGAACSKRSSSGIPRPRRSASRPSRRPTRAACRLPRSTA